MEIRSNVYAAGGGDERFETEFSAELSLLPEVQATTVHLVTPQYLSTLRSLCPHPPHTRQRSTHTPSTAFRHLPTNSARFSYATEGALFISAQLSTDAVSALRMVLVLI